MRIFHNPRCSKSRETLKIIQEKGTEVEVVEYLKNPPSKEELVQLVKMLGISPEGLIRKNEKEYIELYKGKTLSDDEWIGAMLAYPKLIERPIVIEGNKAIIGRPPEKVLELY